MTLQHFQLALAHLIRNPPVVFSDYELSSSERNTLQHFARDHLVKDFSDEMRDKRWSAICKVTSCLRPFIAPRQLKVLCRDDFEAKHTHTPFAEIALVFLEYLANEPYAKAAIRPFTPDYFRNLVQYLHAVSCFSINMAHKHPALPSGSLLSHSCFTILDLDYDVRELAEEIIEPSELRRGEYLAHDDDAYEERMSQVCVNSAVEKRPVTLLFVADHSEAEFRSFEIDTELKTFLNLQLEVAIEHTQVPSCYADLIELGLCQPLSKARLLAEEIRSELAQNGFYHVKQGLCEEYFKEVAGHLGTIVATDDIKLNLSKRKLHSPEALEFHTDSYLSDINAWWCDKPAESLGEMLLVDTQDLREHFSEVDISLLAQLEMECPNRSHSKYYKRTLLTPSENGIEVFYTPWLPVEPASEELKQVRQNFASYVEEKRKNAVIEISFKQGDCLFINNKRVLHGRDSLHPETRRHLKRLWIATQPFDTRLLD